MPNLCLPAIAALLALAAAGPSAAHGVKTPTLEMVHPYTFESGPDDTSANVYMTIESRGPKGDRLRGAATERAASVELRAPAGDGQAPGTRPLASVDIKRRSRVDLGSAGPHLVLYGITKPLEAWDTFTLTLHFERAGRIDVEVLVQEGLDPARSTP